MAAYSTGVRRHAGECDTVVSISSLFHGVVEMEGRYAVGRNTVLHAQGVDPLL